MLVDPVSGCSIVVIAVRAEAVAAAVSTAEAHVPASTGVEVAAMAPKIEVPESTQDPAARSIHTMQSMLQYSTMCAGIILAVLQQHVMVPQQ